MMKVINGRKYDTDSAEQVAFTSFEGTPGEAASWREELYRKRNGEYFLYNEGGKGTIRPLTMADARTWGARHLTKDECGKIFADVQEDKAQISTWVPGELKARIEKLRREQNATIGDIIRAGVEALE